MDYQCVNPFLNDSKDFVLGFEIGRLWERLKANKLDVQTVHADNWDQIVVMARHSGFQPILEAQRPTPDDGTEWIDVRFERL